MTGDPIRYDLRMGTPPITRLAPSPTGALHLGNARTFLVNWALARQRGWRILMRIEDLDGPRIKPDAAQDALDILLWLGIDWDGEILVQSADLARYRRAMLALSDAGMVFSCALSRREVEQAATAPHASEQEAAYPRELRPARDDRARWRFERDDTNYRFAVDDRAIAIDDSFRGRVTFHPAREVGDFVVWTRRAIPAYQLAVVVDDARQGVTDVVRGDDLLPSAARQMLIYRALSYNPPRWWHLPLVVGPDGRRLAKRHGDTRLAFYREHGVGAARIIGLIARWSGAVSDCCEMAIEDFRKAFRIENLPRTPTTFTEDDHRWLLCAGA